MLKIFKSILGHFFTKARYPRPVVKAIIEHTVDRTDPWIRAVNGYKRKLRPAVIRTLNYVGALVDEVPLPIALDRKRYANDPSLRTYFISSDDMQKITDSDKDLRDFLTAHDVPTVYALMVIAKQERAVLGVELSGDVLMREVSQLTVSFESHQFRDPSQDEDQLRVRLKQRALDHLLGLALKRITVMKTERRSLEQYRTLLRSKLSLLKRSGSGFTIANTEERSTAADVEKMLDEINTGLLELGGDKSLETYLDIVIDVLSNPEKHLWSRKEKLIVDRRWIKRSVATDDFPEVTLNMICDSDGAEAVMTLVSLPTRIS